MTDKPQPEWVREDFCFPYRAIRATKWVSDPANPVGQQTGLIAYHAQLWFNQEPFGSGPIWQPARPGLAWLADGTLCYVQPHDFEAAPR